MNRASAHSRAHPAGCGGRWSLVRRALLRLVLAGGMALAVPAAAQQGSGPLYGPVRPADTLWDLALRFRGDADLTPQQAMIAILRANPDAFREGNINALRTGVTLRVPSASEMTAITPGEAAAEFARHDEAWRSRQQTGTAAPAPAPGAPPGARPAEAPAAPVVPAAVSPAAGTAGEEAGDTPAELAEARAAVADLRERLAERDAEIESLLAALFTAKGELNRLRETEAERSGEQGLQAAGGETEDAAEVQGASPARQLPVNPVVLGSALIVLLVLVVVVTLIRRRETSEPTRGEEEDLYGEEQEGDEEEEAGYFGEEKDDENRRGEEGEDGYPDSGKEDVRADVEAPGAAGVEEPGREGGNGAPPSPRMRFPRPAPGAAGAGPAAETDAARYEDVDLPLGLDPDEGEERGEAAPAGTVRGGPNFPDPVADPGSDRHVEVGELDDLDLGTDPDRASFRGLPNDPGSEDRRGPRETSFSDLPIDDDYEDGRGPEPPGLSDLPAETAGDHDRPGLSDGGRRRGAPAFGARE